MKEHNHLGFTADIVDLSGIGRRLGHEAKDGKSMTPV
jgi:hypothetical protein